MFKAEEVIDQARLFFSGLDFWQMSKNGKELHYKSFASVMKVAFDLFAGEWQDRAYTAEVRVRGLEEERQRLQAEVDRWSRIARDWHSSYWKFVQCLQVIHNETPRELFMKYAKDLEAHGQDVGFFVEVNDECEGVTALKAEIERLRGVMVHVFLIATDPAIERRIAKALGHKVDCSLLLGGDCTCGGIQPTGEVAQ